MDDNDALSQDMRDNNGQFIPGDDDGEISGNFGAVINIDIPEYSDWGLASMFPLGGETDQERFDRQVR